MGGGALRTLDSRCGVNGAGLRVEGLGFKGGGGFMQRGEKRNKK